MIGPPTGVVPIDSSEYSEFTRPRISGMLTSWMVAVIIDMVSGPVVNENMKATAVLGRIINVGRLGGGHVEFDCNLHANKRIAYIGVTHRTRSMNELRAEVSNMRADLWDAVEAGKLSLPIDHVFKLEDAEAAQAHMRTNAHFGKIVMVP